MDNVEDLVRIDLNLDAGESESALHDGSEAMLYDMVTSINIACGGHAGTSGSIQKSIQLARERGLSIGAHPSYPDKKNFGRELLNLSPKKLKQSLIEQIETLKLVCDSEGVDLRHVKLHGALYNESAENSIVAQVVFDSMKAIDPKMRLVGLAGSSFLKWAQSEGFSVVAEAFVDRAYLSGGALQPRSEPGSVYSDPFVAAEQALDIVIRKRVRAVDGSWIKLHADTLCIHGDSVNAHNMVRFVRKRLLDSGVKIQSLD